MFELIGIIATAGAGLAGYLTSRDFTRKKLRYVDAAQKPAAPFIAGGVALLAAAPVVWLLPLVGAGTAIILGAGVALGVRSGQNDRRLLP